MACIAAAKMAKTGGGGRTTGGGSSAGFAAVWTALLLIVISVIGTVVMRRVRSELIFIILNASLSPFKTILSQFKTAFPMGALLGVVFVMSNQMLILFVIFADHAISHESPLPIKQAEQAMAVFSFFLFFVYAFFGIILAVFRNEVITDDGKRKLNRCSQC